MSDGDQGVIRIRLLRGSQVAKTWEVQSDSATIGSSKSCRPRIKGVPGVAPRHATISVVDGHLELFAEGGAEIKLNGDAVDFAQPGPADRVQVARLTFTVEYVPPLPVHDDDATDEKTLPIPAPVNPPRGGLPGLPALARSPGPTIEREENIVRTESFRPGEPEDFDDEVTRPVDDVLAWASEEDTADLPTDPGRDESPEPRYVPVEDEDEDEDEDFEEPFDLAELMMQHRHDADGDKRRAGYCTALLVRVVDGRVVQTVSLRPGQSFASPDGDVWCRVSSRSAQLSVAVSREGFVSVVGGERPLSELETTKNRRSVGVAIGGAAVMHGEADTWKLDVFRPPHASLALTAGSPFFVLFLGMALMGHVALGAVVVVLQPAVVPPMVGEPEEVFVDVVLDKPDPDKPVPKPRPQTAAQMAEKAPVVTAEQVGEIPPPKPPTDVDTLLDRLTRSATQGESESLDAALRNIRVVPGAPGGGSFDLMGDLSEISGDGVQYARETTTGGLGTMGGDAVGAQTSELAGGGPGEEVRGKVTKLTSKMTVEGSLSREEVSRVISDHIHEVQACYESVLQRSGPVSGKITYEWTITKTGSVKGVRVANSNVNSTDLADCIGGRIKTWQFPSPTGGSVTISYPFLLSPSH